MNTLKETVFYNKYNEACGKSVEFGDLCDFIKAEYPDLDISVIKADQKIVINGAYADIEIQKKLGGLVDEHIEINVSLRRNYFFQCEKANSIAGFHKHQFSQNYAENITSYITEKRAYLDDSTNLFREANSIDLSNFSDDEF